jgi:hypothetical protein
VRGYFAGAKMTGVSTCVGSHTQKLPTFKKFFPQIFFTFTVMNITKETDEFPNFLDPERVKRTEDKIKNKEIVCDIKNPEDCESCSG